MEPLYWREIDDCVVRVWKDGWAKTQHRIMGWSEFLALRDVLSEYGVKTIEVK